MNRLAKRNMPTRFRRVTYTWKDQKTGVVYEEYPVSITDQIYTDDGISLTEVLKLLATSEEVAKLQGWIENFEKAFRLLGTLMNDPSKTAIEKLYALQGMLIGDAYLVESTPIGSETLQFEVYAWGGSIPGWIFVGCTSKSAFLNSVIPNIDVLNKIPGDLHNHAGHILQIASDGINLIWAPVDTAASEEMDAKIKAHNEDPAAHLAIRETLSKKADQMIAFTDVLKQDHWVRPPDASYVEYIYMPEQAFENAYIDIDPIIDINSTVGKVINDAQLAPSYRIESVELHSFAVLQAKSVPVADIPISVKIFNNTKISVPNPSEITE